MEGNVIQPNGASGGGGFNPTLIKTVTISLSDWGEESSGYRRAAISIFDIENVLRTKKFYIVAYETHVADFYTKTGLVNALITPEVLADESSSIYFPTRQDWYRFIGIDGQFKYQLARVIADITASHYAQWQQWTNNQLVVKIYTID